jgi:hypothetical protein
MTPTDLTAAWLAVQRTTVRMRSDDRGEGVISAAIAVLIMAALGAAMWVAFDTIWDDTEKNTKDKVDQIGKDG